MKAKAQMTMHEPSHVASMESPNCTPEKLQAGDGLDWFARYKGQKRRVEIYIYNIRGWASARGCVNCIFVGSLLSL